MHVVICLNPDGKNFKSRLQRFPALINYCTINWFLVLPRISFKNPSYLTNKLKQKRTGRMTLCKT
jgi:hypothetical protein